MPNTAAHPTLYSFRRCPYAMRARMALNYTQCTVVLREVVLKNKPQALLDASAKATVPVLVLSDDVAIDESLEIMQWALQQNDPDDWLLQHDPQKQSQTEELIALNDGDFKQALDRYKYADRHPQHPPEVYRAQGEAFLQALEGHLQNQRYLMGDQLSMADIAIFPFVRQFAHVDKPWFDQTGYSRLGAWLQEHMDSALFKGVMNKYAAWHPGDEPILFPPHPTPHFN